MKRLDRSEAIFKVLAYVLLTLFALACLYPLLYVLANMVSAKMYVESGQVSIIPLGFQLDALMFIFKDKVFWLSYCNSLFITMYGTIISMLVAICGSYALSKTRLMLGRGFNFMLVFTMWFGAGMIPTLQNFLRFNVNNRYMFIIALGFNAFNMILLRNYFSSVPTEIEEAATIDGANEFQILARVYIPMSKASIATVAMFFAVARWNGYLWASMLLAPSDQPLQVYIRMKIASINDAEDIDLSKITYATTSIQYALIVCSIIPVIIIYPKIQKYFAAGVNVGGVKE